MPDSYFRRLDGDDAGGRYLAGDHTAGPWSPALQHGGPPNALAVLLADRVVRSAAGRDDLVAVRLSAYFVGAVPVGEIEVHCEVLRRARSAALAEVTISAAGRTGLSSRVWFVRDADTGAIATPEPAAPPPPPPDLPRRPSSKGNGWGFGYGQSLRWWFTHGSPADRGPAAAWALPLHPVLEADESLPGLARVALVVDSASGISAELDWAQWSFVNVDLDVHLSRPFTGEWVHMAATTTLGPNGSATARSVIADQRGVMGSGAQTLVVAPIPT